MTIASGANAELSYVREVTHGTTPGSPSMKLLRATNRNINGTKTTLSTEEVRGDRQISDVRHGFEQVGGSVGFELSLESYDDMLELALSALWTTTPATTGVIAMSVDTTSTFDRASGSFISDGFEINDWVISSDFTESANNGTFRVTAVGASALTVDATLTTESAGADELIKIEGQILKMGQTLLTNTFERRFNDLTQYQPTRGVAVNQMSLTVSPESIVGGTFDLLGMSFDVFSGSELGTPAVAPTNSPYDSFTGQIVEGTAVIGLITGIDFTLNNSRVLQAVIGSKNSPDVFEGQGIVTGSMQALFQDATLWNKFKNETETTLQIKLNELGTTGFHAITFPRVKYTAGDMDPPQEGPVIIEMPFQALVDSASATTMKWQRSNA